MEYTKEDKKTNKDTHDLVIKHDVKLNIMCDSIHKIEKGISGINSKLEEAVLNCPEKRKEIENKYFSKRVLMWLMGFMIAGIISIGVYSSNLQADVKVIQQQVKIYHK